MIQSFGRVTAELQAKMASGLAGAGLVWATKVATSSRIGIRALVNTPGVVESLCICILVWLIAKWRSVASQKPVETAYSNNS